MSAEKCGRYKAGVVEETLESTEKLALKNKVKQEKHVEIKGALSGGVGMKRRLRGPNGLCENAETTISCRWPGPA